MNTSVFSALDYTALTTYLVLVVAIGVWVGRGQKDTKEYFLAGRSMGWFPVGISTLASLYSAITYMGAPAEYYVHGLEMASQTLSIVLVVPVVMFVFMPFFHRLQVYTAYEYLEERFDLRVRTLASAVFVFWRILWMGTATYVPALVLHTVTGMPLLETILGVGIAATLYTVAGGMRAVIWTDVCQFFILIGGSVLAVWIIGTDAGGTGEIWRIAEQGGRTRLFDWSLDPTIRVTTWGALMGSLVGHIGMYGADQVSVQRYLTARSLPIMQKSFILNMGAGLLMKGFIIIIGLGLFAYYATNPQNLPESIQGDRVFPYFIATQMPIGLRGMMIAAILAAAMSSIDSGLNSCTTALITDFFKRFNWKPGWIMRWAPGEASHQVAARDLKLSRLLTLGLGVAVTVLACFVGGLGSIIEITNKLVNSFAGPMAAVFLLGMLTRRCGSRGAFWGLLVGSLVTSYFIFYSTVSFLWYGTVGLTATLLVGYLISVGQDSPPTDRTDLVYRLPGF